LVDSGKLQITEDNESIVFTTDDGGTEQHEICQVQIIEQDSEDWKTYLKAGGDPDIPEGSVAVKIVTKDEDLKPRHGPNKNKVMGSIATIKKEDAEAFLNHQQRRKTLYEMSNYDNRNGTIPLDNVLPHDLSIPQDEVLPALIESVHPDSLATMTSDEALKSLEPENIGHFAEAYGLDLQEETLTSAKKRIIHVSSLDPEGRILLTELISENSKEFDNPTQNPEIEDLTYGLKLANRYDRITKSISPAIDAIELRLTYDLLKDQNTRRVRFDQLNYPVWEGHTTHPTRSEGFITKPPFPQMYIQFSDLVNLPSMMSNVIQVGSEIYEVNSDLEHKNFNLSSAYKAFNHYPVTNTEDYQSNTDYWAREWFESGDKTREMYISIGAMVFCSNVFPHAVEKPDPPQVESYFSWTKNSLRASLATPKVGPRSILPQVGKNWKITSPQGTNPEYGGYSSVKNDSIKLGYLHWWGIQRNKQHQSLSKINQGAYFDINTGTVWIPLTKAGGSEGIPIELLNVERNKTNIYLIPAGSGIESTALSETDSRRLQKDWNASSRDMNIYEDTAMKVGDMFMFMMNYMTSPRMQTEEVQAPRAERRRAEKRGSPPPPPLDYNRI